MAHPSELIVAITGSHGCVSYCDRQWPGAEIGDQRLREMYQPHKTSIHVLYLTVHLTLPLPDSSPHPRVQVRKYGEQKLFISPGLLPEAPSQSGPPKPDPTGTPKDNHGKSRRPTELCQRPALTLLGKLNQGRQQGLGHQ